MNLPRSVHVAAACAGMTAFLIAADTMRSSEPWRTLFDLGFLMWGAMVAEELF